MSIVNFPSPLGEVGPKEPRQTQVIQQLPYKSFQTACFALHSFNEGGYLNNGTFAVLCSVLVRLRSLRRANREHWKTLFSKIYSYFLKNPLDLDSEFTMALGN